MLECKGRILSGGIVYYVNETCFGWLRDVVDYCLLRLFHRNFYLYLLLQVVSLFEKIMS